MALIALIGDAPDAEAAKLGVPLVGAPNKTLNQLLRSANIERGNCFVTNVFDTYAPENEPLQWTVNRVEAERRGWAGGSSDAPDFAGRYFDPEFLYSNLVRLKSDLERERPAVIVPLGSVALWALTGGTSITAARGAVSRATRLFPGAKLVPTYHPVHVMKTWKFFTVVVSDLQKALAETGSTTVTYTDKELWIEPNLTDLKNFERLHIAKASLLSVDIETHPAFRQISCVGIGTDSSRAIVVPFVDWRKPNRSYWPSTDAELEAWSWIERILRLPVPKLLQNGTYDAYWLWEKMGIPVMNYSEDTRLLHHALYPEMPKSLAFMGATYAQVPAWKQMREKQGEEKRDA